MNRNKKKFTKNGCGKYDPDHELLHNERYEIKENKGKKEKENQKTKIEELVAHPSKHQDSIILSKIAPLPLTIITSNKELEVFALFGQASTVTLIKKRFCK